MMIDPSTISASDLTRWFAVHSASRTAQLAKVGDSKISKPSFRISATMMCNRSFVFPAKCSARLFACGLSGREPKLERHRPRRLRQALLLVAHAKHLAIATLHRLQEVVDLRSIQWR